MFRRFPVAGSIRSQILGGVPANIGFGLQFAVMAYFTNSAGFLLLYIPIGVLLIVQTYIIVELLL